MPKIVSPFARKDRRRRTERGISREKDSHLREVRMECLIVYFAGTSRVSSVRFRAFNTYITYLLSYRMQNVMFDYI